MIRLAQAECPPTLYRLLSHLRPHFGNLVGAAWVAGAGPWDAFLQRQNGREPHFLLLFEDGTHRYPEMGDMSEHRSFVEMMLAIDEVMVCYDPDAGPDQRNCALILRPHAFILLLGKQRLYVPMPDASAHERLADPARLERDFPGAFMIG